MDLGTLELQLERQGGEMDSEEAEGLRKRVAAAVSSGREIAGVARGES